MLDPPDYSSPPSPLLPGTVTDSVPPDYTTLDIKVKPATETCGIGNPFIYPNLHKKPRGRALIINFMKFTNADERVGSEKDVIHLDQLLQQLGYEVTFRTNLNKVVRIFYKNPFLWLIK